MKAIKKISKAAKAAQKVRLEYLDETQSLVSGASGNNTDDNDDLDEEYADEMSKNWEKISTKRYRPIEIQQNCNNWVLFHLYCDMKALFELA